MSKTFVTGLFKTRAAAEAAVDAIIKRGYTRDDISVLMSDSTRNKEFAAQTLVPRPRRLGVGGAIGATIGSAAAIAAVGTSIVHLSWSGRCRFIAAALAALAPVVRLACHRYVGGHRHSRASRAVFTIPGCAAAES
jgi:hypothetical protein